MCAPSEPLTVFIHIFKGLALLRGVHCVCRLYSDLHTTVRSTVLSFQSFACCTVVKPLHQLLFKCKRAK